jgi:hypothetical protein
MRMLKERAGWKKKPVVMPSKVQFAPDDTFVGLAEQGKDKWRRTTALVGNFGLEALQEWRQAQGGNRQYEFCSVRKRDVLGPDKPLAVQAVYQIVQQMAERVGGQDFPSAPTTRAAP